MFSMILSFFLFFVFCRGAYSTVPAIHFQDKVERVASFAVIQDKDGTLDCLEALDLVSKKNSSFGPSLDLPAGSSYWVFFEIVNKGLSRSIDLKDSFGELHNFIDGIYLIDENRRVVSSYFTLKVLPNKSKIVALKITPQNYSFVGILRLCPKISYFNFYHIVNGFTPTNWMTLYFFICLVAVLIIFEVQLSIVYLLTYMFVELLSKFSHYFLEIGIIDGEVQTIILSLFAVIKYTCLIQLSFILFSYKHLDLLRWLVMICQYFLWFILFVMFFIGKYSAVFTQLIDFTSLFLLSVIALVSCITYHYNFRRNNLFLAASFIFLLLFVVNQIFGFNNIIFLSFNKLIYLLHNGIIVTIVLIKSIKDRWFDKAIAINSDIAFKALRDSYTLKDTLSKFIIYSNFHMDFDAVYVYLEDEVGLHYYSSFPTNDHFGSNEVKNIVDNLDRDKIVISENIKRDPNYTNHEISKYYSSMIVLPLKIDTKSLGTLVVLSSKKTVFTKNAILFAKELSYKAAVILNNYRQIELLNIYNKRVQFEETLRIFQRNTAHDIKAPLRGIKIAVSILMKKYSQDKELFEYLEQVDYAVDSAIEQVKESISMIAEMKEDFDISYLSSELSDLKKLCKMENILLIEDIKVNDLMFGPKKSLRNMLRGVVKNAVEALEHYDKENKEVKVKYYKSDDNKLVIQVRDNGIGISDHTKKKILNHESYTHGKKEGTGHGMLIAKYIVDKLNGDIIIDSVEKEYTCVTIIIDVIKSNLKLED